MSYSRFFLTPQPLKRLLGGLALLMLVLMLAACSTTPTPSTTKATSVLPHPTSTTTGNAPGPRSGGGGFSFVHIATSANTSGNSTELTYAECDYACTLAGRYILVTPVLTANGASTQAYDTHPVGAWFDSATGWWTIINEDQAPIPLGAAFNVYVSVTVSAAPGSFIVTAGSTAASLWINNATANGQSLASVFVLPVLTSTQVYDPHPLDVYFSTSLLRWYIAHEDGTPIQAGASYIVEVNPGYVTILPRQTAIQTNNWLRLDAPYLTYHPDAHLFITQYVFPASCLRIPCSGGSPLNNSAVGVTYSGIYWYITDLTLSVMPQGAIFEAFFT